jgi:hypothetical protein
MQRILLFVLLISSGSIVAQSGGSWKIVLNKKAVLKGEQDSDTMNNLLPVKKADLSNNGIFKIEYDKKQEPGGWRRSIAVFDTLETAIAQRDSTNSLEFYNKDLLKILWSRKKVYIYTWSAPMDKGMAAAIRIRRIRLCTIELID